MTPVAASPRTKTLQIYVATTRERENSSGNVFTANRANALNFARFVVSVPPNHKSGDIEMPTTTPPDPQSSFAILDQAVMSEPDFRKAVASQGDTRRKKRKAFVFVHGFNNNFQESLFRLTQLQADAKIDGIPILFSWPSQGQVAAYEMDKEAASYSRSHDGGVLRAGAITVDDPVVQEAALKAKVQVVDISKLASHDNLGHNQFISVAMLYSKFQHQTTPYRNKAGTFTFADDGETLVRPVDVGALATAQ